MIDLHLHTTASDGRLTPAALVARAAGVGLTVISVTDHDTTAGIPEAQAAADRHGLRLVPGIEITAVEAARDVHVLGYFIDPQFAPFVDVPARAARRPAAPPERDGGTARRSRVCRRDWPAASPTRRADRAGRLAARSSPMRSSRPVTRRIVATRSTAARRRPPRHSCPARGATVGEVATIVRAAGGIASLAHPGLMRLDDAIPGFVAGGLPAIEVWHSDHDATATARYQGIAEQLGLGMSGGSDYHADSSHHAAGLGAITLPRRGVRRSRSARRQAVRSAGPPWSRCPTQPSRSWRSPMSKSDTRRCGRCGSRL